MTGKIVSLADYETQTRNMPNGQQRRSVSVPLKNFQPTLDETRPLVDRIMHALGPYQAVQCQQIAFRARDLARQLRASMGRQNDEVLEMNPAIVSMDFGVVWAFRDGYDFDGMLRADNLTFLAEFTTIQQHIKRNPLFFSRDVRLRFARNGARFTPG